jgi:diguanylate cyclase (GGDEF)-like protein
MLSSHIAQLVFDDRRVAYAIADRDLAVTAVGGVLELFGAAPPRLGGSLLDLVPELIGNEAVLADIWAGRLPRFQLAWINRDQPTGQTAYLNLVLLPYRDDAGAVCSLAYLIEETNETSALTQQLAQSRNELRLAQRQLERRHQQLDALHQAAATLLTTLELDSLLEHVLAAAANALSNAEQGLVALHDDATGRVATRAAWNVRDPQVCAPILARLDDPPAALRKPLVISDLRASAQCANCASVADCLIQSAMRVPLLSDEHLWGWLVLAATRRAAFAESDLDLLESFAAMASAAIANAHLHAEIQRVAITDELTRIYNRRGLFDLGQREFNRARRHGAPLAAILFDLDRLKVINDTFGHAAGDQLLIQVATRAQHELRAEDIFARYGGDEFVVLLPGTGLDSARQIAERLRHVIAALQVDHATHLINTTASFGVATLDPTCLDVDALLTRADRAHYTAKQSGKNRVWLWQ